MKKFKKRRRKVHTRKIFLLNSILVVFLFLGIGYSLLSTELTIDGSTKVTEYLAPTLYNVLYKEAKTNGLAREYTGEHQDSMDASLSTKKIYHWYGTVFNSTAEGNIILNKNNVIFANHCWQMIRTTDTGGVKMIYNGEAENNQCLNTRGTHVGYASRTSQNLASNYWYGTDYTYDKDAKTFKVSGTTEQAIWNATTGPGLIGKYTCKNTNVDGTCATLYLIESYNNTSSAYVLSLNSNAKYSQFGTLPFNSSANSPTYFGYMYGDAYECNTTKGSESQSFEKFQQVLVKTSLSTSYWYADTIDYGNIVANKYSLVNSYQVNSTDDYQNLVGKYTFRNANQNYTNTSVYYIVAVNDSNVYLKQLQNGNLLSAYEPIVFGDSITDNGNDTYTINNPTNVTLSDWSANYANYNNKYTCGDSNITCVNPRYTIRTYDYDYRYINVEEKVMIGKTRSGLTLNDTLLVRKDEWYSNYRNYSDYKYTCNTDNASCTESTLRMIIRYNKTDYDYAPNHYYGTSVIWDGTNYTLVDPIEIENYNNLDNISTHHFICPNYGDKVCSTVAYVYYYTGLGTMYYLTLRDGVTTVEQALSDMFTKNITNSIIKSGVDAWYKHYMLEEYDDYIEDAIFCNNRSIKSLGGWDANEGMTNTYLTFKGITRDLSCPNTDQFSVSNNNAKLTYKVGLMSGSELDIINNIRATVVSSSQPYWLLTPWRFEEQYGAYLTEVESWMTYSNVDSSYGVRPAISLKPGITYSTGDGSMENPYIIDN